MSSVSATSTSQLYATQRPPVSQKSRIASAIGNEVLSGKITATDATALTSALDSIDSSLKSGAGTTASSSKAISTRLDPSSIKDRIESLISDQVDGGKLTSDQASTLKSLFAQGGGHGDKGHGGKVHGGEGGPGGAGGPPPADTADGTASSTASSDDLLASFIQQLKASQTTGTGYAASGTGSTSSASALLFDFKS